MPKSAIPGLKRYFEPKTGKVYCYHRATGTRLKEKFGTPEFLAELAALNVTSTPSEKKIAGSFGALVALYRESADFKDLAERTKADYQRVLNFVADLDAVPAGKITTGAVVRLRDNAYQKHKRRFANYVIAVLSVVFEYGREREMIVTNPVSVVKKVRRPKGMADANRPWTSEERDAVLAAAPVHLKVPIALAMFVGLREADALKIAWERYDGRNISTTTSKAGTFIWWRCPAGLKAVLDVAPRFEGLPHISATSRGDKWTESGFRASWRKFRIKLEDAGQVGKGLTIHGLRHTVATTLREQGFDPRTIADALGQKTTAMAEHYSKNADLREKMEGVADAMDRAGEPKKKKTRVTCSVTRSSPETLVLEA